MSNIPDEIIRVLQAVAILQPVARAWRGVCSETFNDPLFFQQHAVAGQRWNVLIHHLYSTDKQSFTELVSRISTTVSGNLFVNKEAEITSKAMAIRRLSYTLFSGEKDTYMTNLALIQEKIAEVLRSGLSPIVLAEVTSAPVYR